MESVTNEQLIFLDNLIYLDFSSIVDFFAENELELTINTLISEILKSNTIMQEEPACMSKSEWSSLLQSFVYEKNPEYIQNKLNGIEDESVEPLLIKEKHKDFLNDYVIDLENYSNEPLDDGGFRAYTFVKRNDKDEVEDVITIFRGTAGDAPEWEDNVLNANRVWSYQMDKSVAYINSLPLEYGNNITVSGHSKGGNRSQYVTILTDRIGLLELLHIMCRRNIIPLV